jgi:hypothetical protein
VDLTSLEAGDSELRHNNSSYAPPSATKAEVGVRVRPARYIEAKQ